MAAAVLPREGLRDIVQHIVPYLTLEERKRCRLTCKTWSEGVAKHPNFLEKTTLVLNRYSEDEIAGMDIQFQYFPKYISARLEACPLKQGRVMRDYWRLHVQNVLRKLDLGKIICECYSLCDFVNELPVLAELKLVEIHFRLQWRGRFQRDDMIIYCDHGQHQRRRYGPVPVPPLTLRHFSCKGMAVLPHCLLELVQARCGGQLQSFEYDDANMMTAHRERSVPSIEDQVQQIRALIQANIPTLRKFSWRNISTMAGRSGLNSINHLFTWAATDMTLEQPRDRTETADTVMNFLQRSWQNQGIHLLTKLNLTFYVPGFMDRLRIILFHERLRNLREFKLSINGLSKDTRLTLPFSGYQHLQVIEVKQNPKDGRRAIPSFVDEEDLPNTLTTLRVDVSGINTLLLAAIPVRHQNIKVLHIGQLRKDVALGDSINSAVDRFDNYMQLILASLHQLEELAVTDAFTLSDYGLTGIPKETAKMINHTMNYDILSSGILQSGHSISNLRHLKKLNLSGSTNLSDVSIFHLSNLYLREIDLSYLVNVTDFGLIKLASQNRSLEIVTLLHNPSISFFGLTQLVEKCKGLVQIHCSESVHEREFLGLDIPEPPELEFKLKVTVTR